MTRSNPFYALSACAMLVGCWMLSKALVHEAGHVAGLVTLMLVLQFYEGLLVGLGAFLVRTGRARHDGAVVLAIESIFVLDATLLAAECVSADLVAGTLMAVVAAGLALLKLVWVRWSAPDLVSKRTAWLLGAHVVFVLALPLAAAHLASAHRLSPLVLYGFWWLTAALPAARQRLRQETAPRSGDAAAAHGAWTWMPSVLVMLHLWSVGYIHTIDFRAAFLAPFLLGLAAAAGRDQIRRQLFLPALAVLLSLDRDAAIGFHLFGLDALPVSPLRLVLVGVGLAWAYLAWRHRAYWLAALAVTGGVMGLFGSGTARLAGQVLRLLGRLAPQDAYGWGALTVAAAFVLLAAGARRSLTGTEERR